MYNKKSVEQVLNNMFVNLYGFKWLHFIKLTRQFVKYKSSDNMCGLLKTSAKTDRCYM